jgi:SEC-C motif
MSRKKLSHNAPCPCGSGKKYKACCWDKDFEWVEDDDGTVYKSTPMTPEVREALEQLRQAFIAKHGREPGPDDPLFPDLPHPEHLGPGGLPSRSQRRDHRKEAVGPKSLQSVIFW